MSPKSLPNHLRNTAPSWRAFHTFFTSTLLFGILAISLACQPAATPSPSGPQAPPAQPKAEQQGARSAPVSEVVLGATLPMTGGNAPSGVQMKGGYEIAVEEINSQGGIQSLGGAKLRLVVRDHEGKPDIGARQAEILINEDGVPVVLGTYMSGVTVPVSRVTERAETPFLVTDSMADEITEAGLKYLFRIDTKAELATRDMLNGIKWAGEKLGTPITDIALLNEDSAFGQSLKADFEQQVGELGLNVVENLSFKTGTPDLSAQASRIKASGAQWTVGSWYITDSTTIVTTFPSLGLNPTRVSTFGGGMQSPTLLQMGEQAEGYTGFTMWNPDLDRPGVKELAENFQKAYGVPMNQNGAKAYAGIWILKDVLERAGSLDKEKIREALVQTNITSGPATVMPTSPIRFDATGQMPPSHIMIQVQNGEFRTVWPEDVASAELDTTKLKQ